MFTSFIDLYILASFILLSDLGQDRPRAGLGRAPATHESDSGLLQKGKGGEIGSVFIKRATIKLNILCETI